MRTLNTVSTKHTWHMLRRPWQLLERWFPTLTHPATGSRHPWIACSSELVRTEPCNVGCIAPLDLSVPHLAGKPMVLRRTAGRPALHRRVLSWRMQ